MRPTANLMMSLLTLTALLVLDGCMAKPDLPRAVTSETPSTTANNQPASSPTTGQPSITTAPTAAWGRIRGTIVRPPGGDPRSGQSSTTVPVAGDPVHAYDRSDRLIASAVSASDGRFELRVPAGVYRITEDICGTSQHVDVQPAGATSITLTVPNAC
jgi:hypothetical protein